MKIYELNSYNRLYGYAEKTLFINREKAEAIAENIKTAYAEALEKGNGTHWANIIYSDAWVKELEVVE